MNISRHLFFSVIFPTVCDNIFIIMKIVLIRESRSSIYIPKFRKKKGVFQKARPNVLFHSLLIRYIDSLWSKTSRRLQLYSGRGSFSVVKDTCSLSVSLSLPLLLIDGSSFLKSGIKKKYPCKNFKKGNFYTHTFWFAISL